MVLVSRRACQPGLCVYIEESRKVGIAGCDGVEVESSAEVEKDSVGGGGRERCGLGSVPARKGRKVVHRGVLEPSLEYIYIVGCQMPDRARSDGSSFCRWLFSAA